MRPISLLAGLTLLATFAPLGARAAEVRHVDDAALRAVQFVNANEGWAVGDEGVIWHSFDGGQTWERQPSGVRASLRSLHFLDGYTGWVAGRETLPSGKSAGVLLYTRDGGATWRRLLLGALPGLNVVRFVDARTGYLAGDGSDGHPAGVFATTDGGKTWQPLPGPRCPSWLAADFGADGGALAGAWNRQATVRRGRVFAVDTDMLGGRALRGVQLRGEGGVAVGQGGLVLLSPGTRGSTWSLPKGLQLSREVLAAWDFHAVHGAGAHVWAVGRPGSVALHSPDLGKTWEVVRTGQSLPLHGVFFHDAKTGWAVGELGTALATADGGKTWKVTKRGGQRAALLCAHARAGDAALDAVALLGAGDGYLSAGVAVTGADGATAAPARAADPALFADAFRQAGGAAAESLWQFPVGSHLAGAGRERLVKHWDGLHGDKAAGQMLRQLVLALRVWRPDVVITDDPEGPCPKECALVGEAVREAFRRAGDPGAFPEQLKELGLEAWKPAKLYACCAAGKGASVTLDLTAMNAGLGTCPRDYAAGPAAALAGDDAAPPAARGFRLLEARLEGAEAHAGLMQGVAIPAGGPARRVVHAGTATPEALQAVRARASLRALAETPAAGLTDPDRVLAQVGPMLEKLSDDQAAPAAHAIACQYARRGQWALAREAYLLLADRYPAHPLAAEGCAWLLKHNASSEAKRRHDLGQFLVVSQLQLGLPGDPVALPAPAKDDKKDKEEGKRGHKLPEVPGFQARLTRGLSLLGGQAEARKWYQGSLEVGRRLEAFGPLRAGDPALQFCLQAARRNTGDFEGPKAWYSQFAGRQPDGPWRSAALAELWLMNRTGAPPKPVLTCRAADARPYLDGKLDDACWQGVAPAKLGDAAGKTQGAYPTEVRLAHDKEFLYVGVRCGHPAGEGAGPAAARTRDGDLRPFDRVSVMLDLDRDYATCFHLQVDQRGCVAEDCWGDRTWDPRWFAAVKREAEGWVVEAAIPLAALTGDGVTHGRAWAVNVLRALPGKGVQAWSLPAEVPEVALRPEGMGLLLFAAEAKAAAGR